MPAFMKLDDIKGESTDDKHKGEIDIQSFSWGQSNTPSGRAGGVGAMGKVSVQDFHFTAFTGIQSPPLLLATATGERFKKATLTVRRAGEGRFEFFKITMEDVLITGYQVGGAEGGEVPMDQISINFAKIQMDVTEQRDDGGFD